MLPKVFHKLARTTKASIYPIADDCRLLLHLIKTNVTMEYYEYNVPNLIPNLVTFLARARARTHTHALSRARRNTFNRIFQTMDIQ